MTTDTRIIGNYELLEKIAEGGMGAVYKGRSLNSRDIVAIKIIPSETAKNPLLIKRFEQEFRAASLINHPNVVKAIDYCGQGDTPFLVMEFVDGCSLGAKIEQEGRIPEAEAIRIIGEVCQGLHRAHKQGLIHRDVKPDNILLTSEGVAKLTDLGLVKDVEGEMNLTKTGRGLGTPHFMAPEQFRNAKNADVRCDVYSLAATLYTMVTGAIPFDKTTPLDCWLKKTKNDFPTPISLNPELSNRINWAICRAMNSDPAQRPANCREFMEDVLGTGWRTTGTISSSMNALGIDNLPEGYLDATLSGNTEPPPPPPDDLWYMVYKDTAGQSHTVKGNTRSIRKNLVAGSLGNLAEILICRTKTGQFKPLTAIPEFRDLAMQAKIIPKLQPKDTPAEVHGRTPELPYASHRGMSGLGDTPKLGQSPTRPLGPGPQEKAEPPRQEPLRTSSTAPLPFAAAEVPTEHHDIVPLMPGKRKQKPSRNKTFPPPQDLLETDSQAETQFGQPTPWQLILVFGGVFLLLVCVALFMVFK